MTCRIGLSTCVIKSFLSLGFLRPAKAILVPGMYFLGFSRYCRRKIRQHLRFHRSASCFAFHSN